MLRIILGLILLSLPLLLSIASFDDRNPSCYGSGQGDFKAVMGLADNMKKIGSLDCQINEEQAQGIKYQMVEAYKYFHNKAFQKNVRDLTWMRIVMRDLNIGKGLKHECHVDTIFKYANEQGACLKGEFDVEKMDKEAKKDYDDSLDPKLFKEKEENRQQQLAKVATIFSIFEKTKDKAWSDIDESDEIKNLKEELGFANDDLKNTNRFVLVRFFFKNKNPESIEFEELRNWYLGEMKKEKGDLEKVKKNYYDLLANSFADTCQNTKERLVNLCNFLSKDEYNYELSKKQFTRAKSVLEKSNFPSDLLDMGMVEKYKCLREKQAWKIKALEIPKEIAEYDKIAKGEMKLKGPSDFINEKIKFSDNDRLIFNNPSNMVYPSGYSGPTIGQLGKGLGAESGSVTNSSNSGNSGSGASGTSSGIASSTSNSSNNRSSAPPGAASGFSPDSSVSALASVNNNRGQSFNSMGGASSFSQEEVKNKIKNLESKIGELNKSGNATIDPDLNEQLANTQRQLKNLKDLYREQEKKNKSESNANSSLSGSASRPESAVSSSLNSGTNTGSTAVSFSAPSSATGVGTSLIAPPPTGKASSSTRVVNSNMDKEGLLNATENLKLLSFTKGESLPELQISQKDIRGYIDTCMRSLKKPSPSEQRICVYNFIQSSQQAKMLKIQGKFLFKYTNDTGKLLGMAPIYNKEGFLADIEQVSVDTELSQPKLSSPLLPSAPAAPVRVYTYKELLKNMN